MYPCFKCGKKTEWKTKDVTFKDGSKRIQGTCVECGGERLLPKERTYEECILHFGKYKDKNITEVPMDYLVWAIESDVIGGGLVWRTIEYLKEKGRDIKSYRNKVL